jgi:hypothetical protein
MKYILASLLVLVITVVQAGTGPLFRLNTQETANGLATQINTTIPNRTYPRAGLVLPANYTLSSSSCAWMFNNVCMLSLDNSNPQSVYLIGKAGDAPSTLCLNGVGQLNCQQFDMQAVPKMIVAGTQKNPNDLLQTTGYQGAYNLINGNFSTSNVISPSFTNTAGEFKTASCTRSGSFCMIGGFSNTSTPYQLKAVGSLDKGATWFDLSNPPNPNNLTSAQIWANTCSEQSQVCIASGEVQPTSGNNRAYVWIFDIATQTWTDSSYINLNQSFGSFNLTATACYPFNNRTRCVLVGYTTAGQSSTNLPLSVLLDIDSQKRIMSYQITSPSDMPVLNNVTYFPVLYGVSCGEDGTRCVMAGFAYPPNANGNNIPVTYISSNGGLTWSLSPSQPIMPSNTYVDTQPVSCASNGLDCVLGGWSHPSGDRNTSSGLIYITHNGGASWDNPTTIVASSNAYPTIRLNKVACSASGRFCIAVGSIGNSTQNGSTARTSYPYLSYTYNGGQSWSSAIQLYFIANYGNSAFANALVTQ